MIISSFMTNFNSPSRHVGRKSSTCWQGLGFALWIVWGAISFNAQISSQVLSSSAVDGVICILLSDRFVGSCGACGSKYATGLARRAWMVRSMTEVKAPGEFVDAGNLSADMATAKLLLDIDSALGCRYVLIGSQEAALGEGFLSALRTRKLTGVSLKAEGEAQNAEGRGQGGGMVPYAVFMVKGRKVAVTALASTPGSEAEMKGLGETLQRAKKEADSVVLFSYLHTPERDRLMDILGQWVDVVVDAQTGGSSSQVGDTKIISVADRYNEVGELTCGGDGVDVRFHPIPTDGPRDEEVFDIAEPFFRSAPAALREASTSNGVTTTTNLNTARPHPCVPCHDKQVEQWQTTRHASAVQSLRDKGNLSPQCLSCHSELYRRTKQLPVPSGQVGTSHRIFDGVECGSCHGEGLLHTLMPRQKGMDIRRTPEEATCRSCHDAANDPDFNFAAAWEKVRH